MTNQPRTVIFLHLPKTAGNTLADIIDKQYPPASIYEIEPEQQQHELDRFKSLSPGERAGIRMLRGHVGFGLHAYFAHATTYMTMLRDPVDRVLSHYYYVRSYIKRGGNLSGRTWLYDAAEMELEDYVRHARSADARNGQTKLIAGRMEGWDPEDPSAAQPPDLLERAKTHLRDRIAVVGLTERFDESILLFQRHLGWTTPYYIKRNVTRARPARTQLSAATVQLIERENALDMELYAFAQRRFEELLAEIGPAFEWQLRRFRIMNRGYGELDRIRSSVRYRLKLLRARRHHG